MSTVPFYSPKFRAFDANGDPLSGGLLYSYEAGTSTPLDTYTTRAGDIANTNPVELDANGEADVWTTPGILYKFVLADSDDIIQWTVDNVPSAGSGGSGGGGSSAGDADTLEPGGRLSLTTGTPVTTTDVSAATIIFWVPHKHHQVPLYDGTTWTLFEVATELSQATSDTTKSPAAAVASSVYDMFVWSDLGTLRLSRGPAWPTPTARGTGSGTTELERVGCRYVNAVAIANGPAAQCGLYVGSIFSDASAQLNDRMTLRHVWNAYNRTRRPMVVTDPAISWSYSSDTWRAANNNVANCLDFVLGLSEDPVEAQVFGNGKGSLASFVEVKVGIGLDSTSVNSATTRTAGTSSTNVRVYPHAEFSDFPGIGKHTLTWLESSSSAGGSTTTWSGTITAGDEDQLSGIRGHVFA